MFLITMSLIAALWDSVDSLRLPTNQVSASKCWVGPYDREGDGEL